jgi:hypothetical protein
LLCEEGVEEKRYGWRGETYLANKVGVLLFVLGKGDGIFPDVVVCSLVGLAGVFKLGDEAILFLLLSDVLVEGEGIVVLLGLALSARAAFGFGSIGFGGSRRSSIGRDGPSVCRGCRSSSPISSSSSGARIGAPLVGGLYSSIYRCGSLGFKFSVAIGAAPGLLDLLVRVTGMGLGGREDGRRGRNARQAGLRVPVEWTASAGRITTTTTATSATTFTTFTTGIVG